jgi:hypothetical protein
VVSRPDEGIEFFNLPIILPAAPGPWVYSAHNRNEYQIEARVSALRIGRALPPERSSGTHFLNGFPFFFLLYCPFVYSC